MSDKYVVNDVFYSIQGEGARAGTANVFVRFAACNMKCDIEPGPLSPGGFACDTEFASGRALDAAGILEWCDTVAPAFRGGVIFTGGEPALQLDARLLDVFASSGYGPKCIETNGSIELADVVKVRLDWITVSPKVAEHAIKQRWANEVKYVRAYGQGIPQTVVEAEHKLISPALDAGKLDKLTLTWCIKLVKDHPSWRLSVQQHQLWGIR